MQCGEFRARLDAVVDARRLPDDDLQLNSHARHCPACADWMSDYSLLLEATAESSSPTLGNDFALNVLQVAETRRQQKKRRVWAAAGLSVAASLAIAVFSGGHADLAGNGTVGGDGLQPVAKVAMSIAAETKRLTTKQLVLGGVVADGFRPVTSSVYTALNKLWRTLPGNELAHVVL